MLSDTYRRNEENKYTYYLWFKKNKEDLWETLIITYTV